MAKKIEPTSFDLAVIRVVEYLVTVMQNLRYDLPQLNKKYELLESIGLEAEKWSEMVNNYRHVADKPLKQAAIVAKLHQLYRVDPNYIYHYPGHQNMFVEDIVVVHKPVDDLVGLSAHDLRKRMRVMKTEMERLKKELTLCNEQTEQWRGIAKLQQHNLSMLGYAAAEDGEQYNAPPNPAKNPAKPAKKTKQKPGKKGENKDEKGG